ncbi:SGNH/GDSL hydrolase family protein [Halobacillus campisalis]|uniref:SGNH/GDSL hydrolase family protein n=1 Tax=Halobacillus campisalis TaxID=435909 RepID=A0ABW2JYW9_9BACI|nr:SGNH/GDSL hydrolase family protein [Halobacillus campisalis]
MKRIMVLLCCLLLINVYFPSSTYSEQNRQMTAIGDSIPYGYNLTKENKYPSGGAFPFMMGEEKNLEVTNLGIPGLTSEELLQAARGNDLFRETIKNSDYIVLYIGGNDLLKILKDHKNLQGIDMEEVALVVRNLLFNVYSTVMEIDKLTDAEILVYNIYNPYPEKGASLEQPLHYINIQYNSLVELLSHFTNVELVDAYQAFKGHPEYIIKGDVHPTAEGQFTLAEIGLNKMEE